MPYTPGPWWNESGVIHAKGPKWTPEFHSCVHPGYANDNFSWDEVEANGNLMAASPDLLKACKKALAAIEVLPDEFMALDYEQRQHVWVRRDNLAAEILAAIIKAEEG